MDPIRQGVHKFIYGNHSIPVPTAFELWEDIDTIHFFLFCSAICAAFLVFWLAIIHLRYVVVYTSNEYLRSNMYFIITSPVVTVGASVVGMAMPRSAPFLIGATLSYYIVVLFINISLMQAMFGSRLALRKYMKDHRKMIKLAVKPYSCCCTFLPEFRPTTMTFRVCEGLILQAVLIRIVMQIMEICVYYELENRGHIFFIISHGIQLISMWIAFYMVYVLIDLGKERLKAYRYEQLFMFTDWAQTLASFQKIGIDVLVAFDIIPGTSFFPAVCAGNFYFLCIWSWEMLIISMLASYVLHPSKTLLFDKYHADDVDVETGKEVLISVSDIQVNLLDKHEKKTQKGRITPLSDSLQTSTPLSNITPLIT